MIFSSPPLCTLRSPRRSMDSIGPIFVLLLAFSALPLAAPAGGTNAAASASGRINGQTGSNADLSTNAVTARQINRCVAEVLKRPEFSWRMPREKLAKEERELPGFLEDFANWIEGVGRRIGRWIEKFYGWIDRLFNSGQVREEWKDKERDWQDPVRLLLFSVVALTASLLGLLAYRTFRRKWGRAVVGVKSAASGNILLDSGIQPDELPSDEWSRMAMEFLAKNELRFAVRAWFLACLSYLAHGGRLTLARHKSNRDYARELNRKAHDVPDMIGAFIENVAIHEEAWYGFHDVSEQMLMSFRNNHRAICSEKENV